LEGQVKRPDRYDFFRTAQTSDYSIARGSGLSFAAASFGAGATTIDISAFDRILGFDAATGMVEVEAGLTLGGLFRFLEPKGYYLPIQPGYPAISIGGCIAADVHGKNPARNRTFITQVRSLRLFHPQHGLVEISREKEKNLFRATCGGFGLAGIVVTALLQAERLPANAMQTEIIAVPDLPQGVSRLGDALNNADFAFGWHDFGSTDQRFGRGFITSSKFVSQSVPMTTFSRKKVLSHRPQALPFSALNRWTTRAMNRIYRSSLPRANGSVENVFSGLFPFYGREAYFALFGRKGFHESQVIVPANRFEDYLEAIRSALRTTKAVICFVALKSFAGESDLIRFDGTGLSLAVHLPRAPSSLKFLEAVDRDIVELGGRPNAIKDSRLSREVFEAAYPECGRFREIRRAWDPKRIFRSELSDRLGL
jgi:decaprenylphospho-beta-D-ribofuranose 2-oxidase